MKLTGTYTGTVENSKDPLENGRLKIRVPTVHGVLGGQFGYIPVNALPWALCAGLPAGGTPQSGGFDWLPEVGDQVLVRFLDGEPEKPVWEWFTQTVPQSKNYTYRAYDTLTKKPARGAMTRYGHTLEWNSAGMILTTSQGYRMLATDGDTGQLNGSLFMGTPKSNFFQIDDDGDTGTMFLNQDLYLYINDQLYVNAGSMSFLSQIEQIDFTAATNFEVTAGFEASIVAGTNMNVSAADILNMTAATTTLEGSLSLTAQTSGIFQCNYGSLFLGAGASEPLVLGSQLSTFLTNIILFLNTHTHGNGNNGSPTTQAQVPFIPLPTVANLLSTTAFTR